MRGTRAVWSAVGIVAVLQIAFTYLPIANTLFGTAPLSPLQWVLCLAIGAVAFLIFEAEKQVRMHRAARGPA
jgi:magnesium-transporting ATPase (P-type)